jgi:hypothetical protein
VEKGKIEIDLGEGSSILVVSGLAQKIESSKRILGYQNDWDEEGSVGYKKETWVRAIRFVVKLIEKAEREIGEEVSYPDIEHGPDGGIDLDWRDEIIRLLIFIPESKDKPVTYYGDNFKELKIKDSFILGACTEEDLLKIIKLFR